MLVSVVFSVSSTSPNFTFVYEGNDTPCKGDVVVCNTSDGEKVGMILRIPSKAEVQEIFEENAYEVCFQSCRKADKLQAWRWRRQQPEPKTYEDVLDYVLG